MPDYLALLNLFAAKPDAYPGKFDLTEPFTDGETTWATDAHQACGLPATLLNVPKNDGRNYPDLSQVVGIIERLAKPISLPAAALRNDELEELLSAVPDARPRPERSFVECGSCHGSGACECECRGEHECGQCNGGKIESQASRIARAIYENESDARHKRLQQIPFCTFLDGCFNYRYIYRIAVAAELLGCDALTVVAQGERSILAIEIGDVRIFTMPSTPTPYKKVFSFYPPPPAGADE